MAAAPQKTGGPQSAGNSAESALAVSQAASSIEAADVAGENSDEQLAKAWGFSGRRPKLSREALIGVVAIVALLGLFGFVINKNWKNRANEVVDDKAKGDKKVEPAGGFDPFAKEAEEGKVKETNFQNAENDTDTAKSDSDDASWLGT